MSKQVQIPTVKIRRKELLLALIFGKASLVIHLPDDNYKDTEEV